MGNMVWYTINTKKKLPKWKRSVAIDPKTDDVYIPAVACGNEMMIFLCLGYDNEPALFPTKLHKHLYIRASWAAKEYPSLADGILKIQSDVRKWESESRV